MDKKRYQEMIFSIMDYKFNRTPEDARDAMWKDIANFLRILFTNSYIAVVYDDDTDIIVVQYEHNENLEAWGVANPRWITEEEEFMLYNNENSEDEEE